MPVSSYAAALDYLYTNLPVFQRVGASAYKEDLHNTLALCRVLGDPHTAFRSLHIAGTNGKGSTSHMLASIFQSAGYKTGLYTSPHLKEFTERIRVDGVEIAQSFVIDFVARVKPLIEEIQPSFFETTVAMAFDYFVFCKVDVAIVEVGLGGRLDSTNVITPELSVITNIGWDHKDLLGDTLEKIAGEKAGIIKPGIPVVISERQADIDTVFTTRAKAQNAPAFFASDEYHAEQRVERGQLSTRVLNGREVLLHDIILPLQGFYQRKNIIGVLKAVNVMRGFGWKISDEQLRNGLEQVTHQTGLKGRWQILGTRPLTVCDTGHNVDGLREVVAQIKAQSYRRLFMVIGMVKDKDIRDALALLPKEANYYFCQAKLPRALEAGLLAEMARAAGLYGKVVADVNEAIGEARKQATPDDMIFIGGSTFVVAEINEL